MQLQELECRSAKATDPESQKHGRAEARATRARPDGDALVPEGMVADCCLLLVTECNDDICAFSCELPDDDQVQPTISELICQTATGKFLSGSNTAVKCLTGCDDFGPETGFVLDPYVMVICNDNIDQRTQARVFPFDFKKRFYTVSESPSDTLSDDVSFISFFPLEGG